MSIKHIIPIKLIKLNLSLPRTITLIKLIKLIKLN